MIINRCHTIAFVTLSVLFLAFVPFAFADETPTPTPTTTDTPTPTPGSASQTSSIGDCSDNHISVADCPSYLQNKLNDLQGKDKTLSSQIDIADNQVKLTEAKIQNTQKQISDLEKDIDITKNKISNSEGDLDKTSHAFVGRAKAVYQVGTVDPWQVLLTANSLNNFFTRLKYLKIVQLFDKRNIYAAEQAKVNYSNQQDILVDKKKQEEALNDKLQAYTDQLNKDKAAKKLLLTETQGSEANYQRLLSQAKAQLAGFSHFVAVQGGASLLSGQTSCDSWGCYYNQRDSQWGGMSLNGTQYTLASDGCLITSMAMVYSHYGHKVTPVDINSNSQNFATYYPAFLLKTIVADGARADRQSADIDATLSSGNPVVVGISYDGGPLADHFVVFISGNGGNYQMNDPFTPNGHNISFRDRYPNARIVEYEKVVFL
jgi:peptidoglycan hydrolase CwlO-like protein